MSFQLVAVSYVSTVVTNIIVLLGLISVFIWIKEQSKNEFILKHRTACQIMFGIIVMLFLFGESWSNFFLSKEFVGMHWSYMNLEIIALYGLTMQVRSKWQLGTTLVLTTLWLSSAMSTFNAVAFGLFLVLVLVEVGIHQFAKQIFELRWVNAVAFVTVTVLVLRIAALTLPGQDVESWVRQLVAMLILSVVSYEYSRGLSKMTATSMLFEHEAKYDSLTGLRNFRMFSSDLEARFIQFRQSGKRYAIYAMDVDHFKHINDTYGHLMGNTVLKQIAACIEDVVAKLPYEASLYRTGGEEFTIILQAIAEDSSEAERISRHIQDSVSQLTFQFDQGAPFSCTVSMGEERVQPNDKTALDAFKRADKYLYTSKHNGRNAITLRGKTLQRQAEWSPIDYKTQKTVYHWG